MMKFTDYLMIKEAAELLGVTTNTLRNWEHRGWIQVRRHPINGYRLYERDELNDMLRRVYQRKN